VKSTNLLSATRAFWARRKPGRITRQMTKRMAVDATLVNLSLAVALFLRYILASWSQDGGLFMHQHLMLSFLRIYLYSAWLLTPPALLIFHFSGFYTRGRIYISRYKALVILQAVTLTYLAFGSLVFLAGTYIGLPRSVLPVGWVLTLLSVGGVRVAYVWLEKEILQDLGSVARVQVQDPVTSWSWGAQGISARCWSASCSRGGTEYGSWIGCSMARSHWPRCTAGTTSSSSRGISVTWSLS